MLRSRTTALLLFVHCIHRFQTKIQAKSIVFQARYKTTTRQQVKYDAEHCPRPALLISPGYVDLSKKSDFQGRWVWHMKGSPSWSLGWKKEEGHICRPDPWERLQCQHHDVNTVQSHSPVPLSPLNVPVQDLKLNVAVCGEYRLRR